MTMIEQTGSGGSPLVEVDAGDLGPAMLALRTERQRRFVRALFVVKQGKGRNVRAAKLAGYNGGNPNAWATIAHRLISDPKIQEAMREEGDRQFVALGPAAIVALDHLIANPKHRDHGRAVGMVMDRLIPVTTVHHVKSERRHVIVDKDQVLKRIAAIAARVGLDPRKMAEPVMIEGEAVDVTTADSRAEPAHVAEVEGDDDAVD